MSSGAQSDTNPGETMRLAVERFRTRMESSNRCFIQDCVDEIEAMRLLTEDGKFSLMRPYWYELGVTGLSDWNYDAPRGPVLRARETENVSRLEDLKTIFHEHMDGIIPPMLVTDKWRQIFLETIENVCNEAAVQDKKDEDFHIPVCDELGHFIKYANGVQHPDFCRSGKASTQYIKEHLDLRHKTLARNSTRPLVIERRFEPLCPPSVQGMTNMQ
ncbi:hypothetical protein N7476_009613 [Penicillium atrosanguineum]|uniref:Uncharacterized protein n=1 Tax=Penicillium atrosanguineum TaxID=1132637 RepID=A0A9W9PNL8_9EURO|nr:hypothetical protein N7476_009613 [Penicillium atrosanguineum]